jgi:error-prone DNA polymerase
MGARMMLVRGRIQRAEGVTHLVADIIENRSHELSALSEDLLAPQRDHGDGATSAAPDRGERRSWNDDARSAHPDGHGHARRHPRDVRVLPPSRDFH